MPSSAPWQEHSFLLIPLAASVVYSVAAIAIKRAQAGGVAPRAVTRWSNLVIAVAYQPLWLLADRERLADPAAWPWAEAAVMALLYIGGNLCTFLSLHHGTVSVATPMLGTKVIFVALCSLALVPDARFRPALVAAAVMSAAAVAILTSGGQGHWRGKARVALLALGAAAQFGLWDVMNQRWIPQYGLGLLAPISFAMVAVLTVAAFPPGRHEPGWPPPACPGRRWLWIGAVLMAAQTLGMIISAGVFRAATATNIVYNTRVFWSVVLAWAMARGRWAHTEDAAGGLLARRLVGAALLFGALLTIVLA